MSPYFIMTRRLEFMDTDMAGIAHFTTFFRYMETAEHELFRSLGLPIAVQNQTPHIGWPRVNCGFEFMAPLRFGEAFEVHIAIKRFGKKSITYEARIVREGQTLAQGFSTNACCELSADKQLRAVPVPEHIIEKLKPYLLTELNENET